MSQLPENVLKAWDSRQGPVVLSTVNSNGMPNSIWATCVSCYNEEAFVVADNYFDKTRENIFAGSKGALLFITKDNKSFQVKGTIEYHRSGPVFDDMKTWNPPKHPGHGAALLKVEEVYSGSDKLL